MPGQRNLRVPKLGCILPDMGTEASRTRRALPPGPTSVADALFTKGQQRVLGVLFGNPARSYYTGEIIALTGGGTGAVQRLLARLESSALVTAKRIGNQKHYQANNAAQVFTQLHKIVLRTFDLAGIVHAAPVLRAPTIDPTFAFESDIEALEAFRKRRRKNKKKKQKGE